MKENLLIQFIQILITTLKPDMLKRAVDALLDVAEDAIAASETKVDDSILLPLIELIRLTFGISDNDKPKEVEAQ